MKTGAHNIGREERRALLEQRRAAVARQLRRLAIELTDLDRQLHDIKHRSLTERDYQADRRAMALPRPSGADQIRLYRKP